MRNTSGGGLDAVDVVEAGLVDLGNRPSFLSGGRGTSSSLVKVLKRRKRTSAVSVAEYLEMTPDCLIK